MTLRTPEEAPNCVDSTVFAEVELTHYCTLQPPLAAYLDIHRSIAVCSWCGASLDEEYAGNSLLRAFLTCTDWTHVYWRSNCDGAMEPCSSTVYTRVCRGADTRPRIAFIAAGAPIGDVGAPDPGTGRLQSQ